MSDLLVHTFEFLKSVMQDAHSLGEVIKARNLARLEMDTLTPSQRQYIRNHARCGPNMFLGNPDIETRLRPDTLRAKLLSAGIIFPCANEDYYRHMIDKRVVVSVYQHPMYKCVTEEDTEGIARALIALPNKHTETVEAFLELCDPNDRTQGTSAALYQFLQALLKQ